MKNPCAGCRERSAYCHSGCERYETFRKRLREENRKIAKERKRYNDSRNDEMRRSSEKWWINDNRTNTNIDCYNQYHNTVTKFSIRIKKRWWNCIPRSKNNIYTIIDCIFTNHVRIHIYNKSCLGGRKWYMK